MTGSTMFVTSSGSDGFVAGRVLSRMKGNSFVWTRSGLSPAAGSHFEIRPKSESTLSPLEPSIPAGVDEIRASVNRAAAPPGTVYRYSLWQVLADGSERELHDPELEIGM